MKRVLTDGPLAPSGCARLGISGKPVEFSADHERMGRKDYVCLNPAYRGSGQLGIYIPAACTSESSLNEFRILNVEVPRQAVRGYELVIWGTVLPSTREVVAHHQDGRATGAVLSVGPGLANTVGASRPYRTFVVELPIAASCHPIELRAVGSSDAIESGFALARGSAWRADGTGRAARSVNTMVRDSV